MSSSDSVVKVLHHTQMEMAPGGAVKVEALSKKYLNPDNGRVELPHNTDTMENHELHYYSGFARVWDSGTRDSCSLSQYNLVWTDDEHVTILIVGMVSHSQTPFIPMNAMRFLAGLLKDMFKSMPK